MLPENLNMNEPANISRECQLMISGSIAYSFKKNRVTLKIKYLKEKHILRVKARRVSNWSSLLEIW